ncbi:LPXTG cell wall anchor domain-containing protein [Roseibium sp. RKSG952]|uniref:LPXTG cell wall anchor domain-containing protein n=1 Tax=Roseibium sp. RKSG952 TaxID=2529384 RepID=UPI0012BC1059|nr:LPXTG cell wall anchor domain-containing protein [Roseibium sp. RKSG952]MTI03149.1 LPXTG cell wall anchor domain-containing protein [Roseibium sp. RKSG952]
MSDGISDIWQFLISEDNRNVLAFIGTGAAAIGGALLSFRKRKKESPQANNNVSASHGGIAIGGDANVRVTKISFQGVAGAVFLVIGASLIGLVVLLSNVASAAIPSHYYFASCERGLGLVQYEVDSALEFYEFLENNDGKHVYVYLDIGTDNSERGCERDENFDPEFESETYFGLKRTPLLDPDEEIPYVEGWMSFDLESVADRRERMGNNQSTILVEGLRVSVTTDECAGSALFFFPREQHLDNNSQYLKRGRESFLKFDGVFVAHVIEGNGICGGYLEPTQRIEKYERYLKCQRSTKQGFFYKLVNLCPQLFQRSKDHSILDDA